MLIFISFKIVTAGLKSLSAKCYQLHPQRQFLLCAFFHVYGPHFFCLFALLIMFCCKLYILDTSYNNSGSWHLSTSHLIVCLYTGLVTQLDQFSEVYLLPHTVQFLMLLFRGDSHGYAQSSPSLHTDDCDFSWGFSSLPVSPIFLFNFGWSVANGIKSSCISLITSWWLYCF